ncbi:hypothetical protein LG634_32270 [Streptomyces bambusae]|uniref:hypothetical protein n=1 Tax=Streptomyces bambusae TaxID=1550616 RepID=UPI001CFFB398|nr:hypothetical protein [Streptomyces bambusae]MCB5169470.1 hypothetical protein [Streptomyces bambusae]
MWQSSEFTDEHDGRPVAVLADGSEPKPFLPDPADRRDGPTGTDWWDFDGTDGTPRAAAVRAGCSCGWRGADQYAIDWRQVAQSALPPFSVDIEGPLGDWRHHIAEVEARTVPLPEHVAELLRRVDTELEALADTGPLAALRAAATLERTAARVSRAATRYLGQDEVTAERVATGLGISLAAARSRLLPYEA